MNSEQIYTVRVTRPDGHIFRNQYIGGRALREGLSNWAEVLLPGETLVVIEGIDPVEA